MTILLLFLSLSPSSHFCSRVTLSLSLIECFSSLFFAYAEQITIIDSSFVCIWIFSSEKKKSISNGFSAMKFWTRRKKNQQRNLSSFCRVQMTDWVREHQTNDPNELISTHFTFGIYNGKDSHSKIWVTFSSGGTIKLLTIKFHCRSYSTKWHY